MHEARSSLLSLDGGVGGSAPPGTWGHPLIWTPQRPKCRACLPTPGPHPHPRPEFPRLLGPRPPPLSQPRSSQVSVQPLETRPFQVLRLLSAQLPTVFGRIPETSLEHPTALTSWRPRAGTMEATPTAPFLRGADNWRGSPPACPNKLRCDWLPPYSAACAYWFTLVNRFMNQWKAPTVSGTSQ